VKNLNTSASVTTNGEITMNKKILIVFILLVVLVLSATTVMAGPPPSDKPDCIKIQDGVLTYSAGHYLGGQPLTLGYDGYGYNYQAHLFNGSYSNVYLGRAGFPPYDGDDAGYLAANPGAADHWAWPYRDTEVLMKWNQDWLANVDCDEDGLLDRHFDTPTTYIGSGAWETNHMWGSYEENGQTCNWDYFTKIIAAPDTAYVDAPYDIYGNGTYYAGDGTEIGAQIWGAFATIQEVENDPCAGIHGIQYLSPDHPGFGGW
jgi:hypothetical protein